MTGDRIQFDSHVLPGDRARASEILASLAMKRQGSLLYTITRPPMIGLLLLPCVYSFVTWLAATVPQILASGIPEEFGFGTVLTVAIGIYVLWYEAALVWRYLVRGLGLVGREQAKGEGVLWGAQRVIATPDGLTIKMAKREMTYRWSAFLDFKDTKQLLLLLLTPGSAVVISKSGFSSKADERAFLNLVVRQSGL